MSEVKRYDPMGYDRLSGYMQQHPEGDYVRHADYAALEAECGRLVERTGYLVEFVQQMARQQGEPYYQKLAKAALKKWSEP